MKLKQKYVLLVRESNNSCIIATNKDLKEYKQLKLFNCLGALYFSHCYDLYENKDKNFPYFYITVYTSKIIKVTHIEKLYINKKETMAKINKEDFSFLE